MSQMAKYRVVITWNHRKWGPKMEKLSAEGTSIRRAIHHALLGFFSDASNRSVRRDAHQGIRIEAWRVKP